MAEEYIEREVAIQYFKERSKAFIGHEPIPPALVIMGCANEVDAIPAADVVEVVRCKDCRFTTGATINMWNEPATLCGRDGDIHPENWFCAAGERENNDD